MPLRPEDIAALAATHYGAYDEPDQQLFALLVDVALAYHDALAADVAVPDLEDPASFAPRTGLAGVPLRDAVLLGLGENMDMRLPHLPIPQPAEFGGAGPCQQCAGPLDAEVHRTAG